MSSVSFPPQLISSADSFHSPKRWWSKSEYYLRITTNGSFSSSWGTGQVRRQLVGLAVTNIPSSINSFKPHADSDSRRSSGGNLCRILFYIALLSGEYKFVSPFTCTSSADSWIPGKSHLIVHSPIKMFREPRDDVCNCTSPSSTTRSTWAAGYRGGHH